MRYTTVLRNKQRNRAIYEHVAFVVVMWSVSLFYCYILFKDTPH